MDRQRMDARHQLRPYGAVDGAVLLDPADAVKRRRPDGQAEMALATFAIPCMAAVAFTFIHDFNHFRVKTGAKPALKVVRYRHFSFLPPSIPPQNV